MCLGAGTLHTRPLHHDPQHEKACIHHLAWRDVSKTGSLRPVSEYGRNGRREHTNVAWLA